MKLLIVADLHYTLPQFDWVLGAAHNYDAVILAGDLLDIGSMVDLGAQMVVVKGYLRRLRQATELLVCSGNHDLDGLGANGEKAALWLAALKRTGLPVDGDSVTLGSTLITLCPWWDGPETQREIGAQLEAAAANRPARWIWVYHAPPPDSPTSWGGKRYYGDAALTGWIVRYQPDVVFCGHVHEAPFVRDGSWADKIGRTWVFNAGRQIGDIPTTISVDTDVGEAAWLSLEGAELVRLDEPLVRPLQELRALPAWFEGPRAADRP